MKRQRLPRPKLGRSRRANVALQPSDEAWTRRDRLQVWGLLAVLTALIFGIPLADMKMKYNEALDSRLRRWKQEYRLSDEQIRKIREIEEDFHDFRWRAFTRSFRTDEEIQAHEQKVASHLGETEATLFLSRHEDQRE